MSSEKNNLDGVGGWLYLVIFGLFVSIVRVTYMLITMQLPILSDGTWEILTTPSSDSYHSLWAPLLLFEIVGNVGIVVLATVTLVLMMIKSKWTPKLAITWLVWSVLFVTGDYFLGDLIPVVAAQNDIQSLTEVFRSIIATSIWVPYFLVSERVKKTFVR